MYSQPLPRTRLKKWFACSATYFNLTMPPSPGVLSGMREPDGLGIRAEIDESLQFTQSLGNAEIDAVPAHPTTAFEAVKSTEPDDLTSCRAPEATLTRPGRGVGSLEAPSSTRRPTMTPETSTCTSNSTFSRHDSLFSFGASSSRNAAELKSFLGNSSSRLRPGATVLPLQADVLGKGGATRTNAVSLEQAKPRARVEVDIVLENDCCIEGGYLRGVVKLRIRKRHRKEGHVLIADGKVRVIGFESIPGEPDRHAFYQRASPLSAVTDAYGRVYDSQPDPEGFSRAMEGVHILPFAMHLPSDGELGSPTGAPCLRNGVSIRYIALISVKVKDSETGKRSIAHFYRDCQIWPRFDPAVILAAATRPLQASTAGSLSVIGGGKKVRLTAMLPRMTWIAGQRCYVHLSVANETKKSIKSVTLTLVRTITLFKPRRSRNGCCSVDPDACQTATTHKVVGEAVLERSQAIAKGHASAEGWWTGVAPGQEAQFAHHILISPDALSVPRARLIEVEYSIQVALSAGALTTDVRVTLPIRIINFLSLDPIPSAPLLAADSSYARLVPRELPEERQNPSINCQAMNLLAGKARSHEMAPPRGQCAATPHTTPPLPCESEHKTPWFFADEASRQAGGSVPDVRAAAHESPIGTALHVVNPDAGSRLASTPQARTLPRTVPPHPHRRITKPRHAQTWAISSSPRAQAPEKKSIMFSGRRVFVPRARLLLRPNRTTVHPWFPLNPPATSRSTAIWRRKALPRPLVLSWRLT
ncbi:hypothetical protein OH77DRAFT_419028 [Trametes cingulata]|nr:hypothetical protein OH77DRAFT_419028 [Trametes cingulata]